jgi:dUTP pyrophosphatase
MKIRFKKIKDQAIAPSRGSDHSAALDLYACQEVKLIPGQQALIDTGIILEIPHGYWGSIRDRSGLAVKHGLHVMAGVIDSDYRGEIKVALINLSQESYQIKAGDRVAQMIISKHEEPEMEEVEELEATSRGENRFGSTGY